MPTSHSAPELETKEAMRRLAAARAAEADVLALADLVLPHVEDCTDRALRRLRDSGETIAATDQAELRDDVREVLRLSLELFRDVRAPATRELGWCRSLGLRRAMQGIALNDVVRWLHSTALVLWELLADLATDARNPLAQQLVERAAGFWSTLDVLSSTISEGHHETTEQLALEVRREAAALLAAIERYPERSQATEELARDLGLDPHGPLVVAVHSAHHRAHAAAMAWVVAEQPDRTVVFAQPSAPDDAGEHDVALVLEANGLSPAGVGLNRRGMAGALLSLRDAQLAFGAALALRRVVRFRDHWLDALGVRYRHEHQPLVVAAVDRIRCDPQLRVTLVAHLEHHGSLTACGRALGLHANTVAYRLRQFCEQTGIDARQAAGLALTRTALTLAEMDEHGPDDTTAGEAS